MSEGGVSRGGWWVVGGELFSSRHHVVWSGGRKEGNLRARQNGRGRGWATRLAANAGAPLIGLVAGSEPGSGALKPPSPAPIRPDRLPHPLCWGAYGALVPCSIAQRCNPCAGPRCHKYITDTSPVEKYP